jgi:hypothetical protein
MKLYCHIQENAVYEGPRALPETFANVSNFHCLDDKTLISYGWLPYEKVSENKEVIVSSTFEILKDKVIERVATRNKLKVEVKQEEASKLAQEWALVRAKRDALLAESDKHVVIDKWMSLSEETKALYVDYRKKLRDLPQDFSSPSEVVFPVVPSTVPAPAVEEQPKEATVV